jgi:hypothetical protein
MCTLGTDLDVAKGHQMAAATRQGITIQNDGDAIDASTASAASDPGPDRHAFLDAARTIVGQSEAIFGAEAGFVAWDSARTGNFDLTYLDPGRLQMEASRGQTEPRSAALPPPLRRLARRATKTRRPTFSNALLGRESTKANGNRQATMRNALVAPILSDHGDVAGLVGLLNKPGGFSRSDGKIAEAMADMVATAMGSSLSLDGLGDSRRRLEEQLQDAISLSHAAESRARSVAEA